MRARAGPHRPAEVHEAATRGAAHVWVFDCGSTTRGGIAHELRHVTVDDGAIKDCFPERIQQLSTRRFR